MKCGAWFHLFVFACAFYLCLLASFYYGQTVFIDIVVGIDVLVIVCGALSKLIRSIGMQLFMLPQHRVTQLEVEVVRLQVSSPCVSWF